MRLLILGALLYLFYRILRTFFRRGGRVGGEEPRLTMDEMVQDPFCGTYVSLRDAERRIIEGEDRVFCSSECADNYEKGLRP